MANTKIDISRPDVTLGKMTSVVYEFRNWLDEESATCFDEDEIDYSLALNSAARHLDERLEEYGFLDLFNMLRGRGT